MNSASLTDPLPNFSPVPATQRIQALDVVRGFALIGILLMNIEFFNRPMAELGSGLAGNLAGADWVAGWFVYLFVQGKFWTMFSLLFGMGFAVMLTRAEHAGRNFLGPYLRRIAALALFGTLHHIFIWGGDILFSYAVGAVGLLILMYGNWMAIVVALLVLLGLGFVPGFSPAWQVAGGLFVVALAALFLRRGTPTPDVALARTRRVGVAMYLVPFMLMTAFGLFQYFTPTASPANARAEAPIDKAVAERRAEQQKQVAKQASQVVEERRVMTRGSYAEAVQLRANHFVERAPGEAMFAVLIIGMFLLGAWFVRSGVMENTAANLPLFRKLVVFGLPIGLGLGFLGSSIATGQTPGLENDPFLLAMGLTMIGNLPACLGYVGLIVLMLHGGTALSRIQVLAPLGRMALTNYLTHSIIGSLYFYGYGLGHWGMGRAAQMGFVAVVIALQLVFCHWWLARYRYGPMEWLWRAITYWQVPAMRRESTPATVGHASA